MSTQTRRLRRKTYRKSTRAKAYMKSRRAWFTPQLRRKLEVEAKKLHMTPSEYTRLCLSLSNTIRDSLQLGEGWNPKEILQLLENPLFSVVLRWVTQSTLSGLTGSGTTDETTETPEIPSERQLEETVKSQRAQLTNPPTPTPQVLRPNQPGRAVQPNERNAAIPTYWDVW